MSNRIDLNVEPRTLGKHNNRQNRVNRKIPAVVYGSVKNANILVEEGQILKYNVRAFENALFNIKGAELNNVVALIKKVQVHPLTRKPVHVDFFALDLKKAVRVSVELRPEGKPVGLAEGGLLNMVNRQIEIECLPTEIPAFFTVDVSELGIGQSLHVSDVKLPAGVKLISSPDLTVAVVALAEEEVLTPTPAAGADAAAGAAPAAGAAAPAAGAAAPAAAAPAKDAKAAAPAAKK
jgi:large subunit ribosomal protein L25